MDLPLRDLPLPDPRQSRLPSHRKQLALRLRRRHGHAPAPLGH